MLPISMSPPVLAKLTTPRPGAVISVCSVSRDSIDVVQLRRISYDMMESVELVWSATACASVPTALVRVAILRSPLGCSQSALDIGDALLCDRKPRVKPWCPITLEAPAGIMVVVILVSSSMSSSGRVARSLHLLIGRENLERMYASFSMLRI